MGKQLYMEISECENTASQWVLLAEDDKLFSTLFLRFWKQSFPAVKVLTAVSNAQVLEIIRRETQPPSVVILDLNLEDGSSQHLVEELNCPTWLWSASQSAGCKHKPMGRSELTGSLAEIARLGRLDVPSQ